MLCIHFNHFHVQSIPFAYILVLLVETLNEALKRGSKITRRLSNVILNTHRKHFDQCFRTFVVHSLHLRGVHNHTLDKVGMLRYAQLAAAAAPLVLR